MQSRGVPVSFWLLVLSAMLIAGIGAIIGFAIDDATTDTPAFAIDAANEAAIDLFEAGLFVPDESDPALALLGEDAAPLPKPPPPPSDGPAAPPADPDALLAAADPGRGQALFFENGCNVCHGDTGQGGIGPKIAKTQIGLAAEIQQYRTPGEAMPAFSADLVPDADVANIYAWLQTLPD